MYELTADRFPALTPMFGELAHLHGSVSAVLANPSLGQVLVDNLHSPGFAILRGPEGLYLAGKPQPNLEGLRQAIADWDYVYPSASWLPAIDDALPNRFMIAHERIRLTLSTKPTQRLMPPDGFALSSIPDTLEFSITRGNEVVSRCSADMQVGDYAEFGVWTHPAYRGRGLAAIVASSCIAEAFGQGIGTAAWHCHASNKRSLKVAGYLGFEATDNYRAYSASLPAENEDDLTPDRFRELAEHFETGASEIPWLEFHAAAGWVLGGEHDRALSAVERLVAGGWTGKAEWLERHWALEKLAHDPRFVAAVRRQRDVLQATPA